ncbi:queuosine precursor transporter [Phycisphaeraceae bacterium D3-23]
MPDTTPTRSPLDPAVLHRRRERVFLLLAGLFLGTLAMLNILGISRFIVLASMGGDAGWKWGVWGEVSFALAVGVLPYPLTFLCTDLISEFYGRRRANAVVWVGLVLNVWVMLILWVGGKLPMAPEMVSYGVDALGRDVMGPPLPEPVYNDDGTFARFNEDWTFYRMRQLAFGAVVASMAAYLLAQFVDVYLFHYWKRLTKGKMLWLRNNGSTMVSQLVDTVAVILITHYFARALPINANTAVAPQLVLFIATGYVFKFVVAALDTPVIYLAVYLLKGYLGIDPAAEHAAEQDEAALYANRP